jgi:hypothetical protein
MPSDDETLLTLEELIQQDAHSDDEASLEQQLNGVCSNGERSNLHNTARSQTRSLTCNRCDTQKGNE